MTKFGNEIYVLCKSYEIHVFEDQYPFRLQKQIGIREISYPNDIESSEKKNCLYVCDYNGCCIWKITRETDDKFKIMKWLAIDNRTIALSVNSDGQLLVVSAFSQTLLIFGSDAEIIRSIELPEYIEDLRHAVESSIGNFIILHFLMIDEEREAKLSLSEWESNWVVSELTRDGQMITRSFIPSNEMQQMKKPFYLSLDSDDRVFVADTGNGGVVLLDSDLKWNQIHCPNIEEMEETKVVDPWRLYFDKETRQLIVGGFDSNGVNVYICQLLYSM